MLAQEARKMGIEIKVLDPTPNCPASSVALHTMGSFRDPAAITAFAQGCDLLTVEIEHIDVDALEQAAAAAGIDVQPTPFTLRVIQDKYAQKEYFQKAGVPLPEFRDIKCAKCASNAGTAFGYPYMLKAKRMAYDGKGNAVVTSPEQLPEAVASLGGYATGLYAEKMVPFVCELAVMVARGRDGSLATYPVVQTIHKNNICHTTEVPANVPPSALAAAQLASTKAIGCLQGAGIFGVELFLLPDGSILLNEVAPRPHNSGHYTIEACGVSQYEAHLRAVLGWPLGDTSLKVGSSIMLNVLGESGGEEGMCAAHALMGRAYQTPGASVHWYGKSEVAAQRKIGHITIVGESNGVVRKGLRAIDAAAADAVEAATIKVRNELTMTSGEGSKGGEVEVGIIMGSDSDLPTMKAAAEILEEFGIACEVTVVSAHRTPERMFDYAQSAHKRGLKAIIAGAGGAAHLPGMVAAMTPLPVIGVPVKPAGAHLDGMDALLSIVQMPRGVPVATVAIGNSANAGLLAVRIVGTNRPEVLEKMLKYQAGMKEMVLGKAARLEDKGWRDY
jgi:phosphoribosylaminoimidazole carboxylase